MSKEVTDSLASFPAFKQSLGIIARIFNIILVRKIYHRPSLIEIEKICDIPMTIITATQRKYAPTLWPRKVTEAFTENHKEYIAMVKNGM